MAENSPLRFFSDARGRHLVCWPYSIANLHRMAAELGLKRCWFHAGRLAHYDMPKTRIEELTARTEVVSSKDVLRIIKGELRFD